MPSNNVGSFILCMVITALTCICVSGLLKRSPRQVTEPLSFENQSYRYCIPSPVTMGTFVTQLFLSNPTESVRFSIPVNIPTVAINPLNGQLFITRDMDGGKSITFIVQAGDTLTGQTTTAIVTVLTSPCDTMQEVATSPLPPVLTPYHFVTSTCAKGEYIGSLAPFTRSAVQTTYNADALPAYIRLFPNGQMYLMGSPPENSVTFVVKAVNGSGSSSSAPVTVTTNCDSAVTSSSKPATSAFTITATNVPQTLITRAISVPASPTTCVASVASATSIAFGQYEFAYSTRKCGAGTEIGQVWLAEPAQAATFSLLPDPTLHFTIDEKTGIIYAASPLPRSTIFPITVLASTAFGLTAKGCIRVQTVAQCAESND